MEPHRNLTTATSGSSAAGSGGNWLRGWSGLAICALVIVGAILVFGGALGGTQEAGNWLLLLLVLPCAIMMFMCLRHMGGNQGEAGDSNRKTGAPRTGPDDGR